MRVSWSHTSLARLSDTHARTPADVPDKLGWAFGLGLERIAMVLYSIPDIRLFWSQDPRFLSQFQRGQITTFKPYSKHPSCFKDLSFWLPDDHTDFHENDFCDLVRDVAGDVVEHVEMVGAGLGWAGSAGGIPSCSRVADRQLRSSEDGPQERVLPNQLPFDGQVSCQRCCPAFLAVLTSRTRSLSNEETNELHARVALRLRDGLGVEIR